MIIIELKIFSILENLKTSQEKPFLFFRGEDYAQGAIDYFEASMRLNQLLRTVMGEFQKLKSKLFVAILILLQKFTLNSKNDLKKYASKQMTIFFSKKY